MIHNSCNRVILRKQKQEKLAILYEIIAENTSEEMVSQRRNTQQQDIYSTQPRSHLKAAEQKSLWDD